MESEGRMKDAALQALYEVILPDQPALLLADEQCSEPPQARAGLQAVSNRFDVAKRLEAAGIPCQLNDFELVDTLPPRVYYRVSKEKALVHHVVNQVLAALPIGGCLVLSGYKGDGAKTYIEKSCAMVAAAKSIKKMAGGALLATIEKRQEPLNRLDDSAYTRLQIIDAELNLFSKPGIYGWKKIDRGSLLLAEQLPAVIEALPTKPESVLDLGCGYGYLSVMTKPCLPAATIVATDNSVTALRACEKNFAAHNIVGEIVADDCAAGISQCFDLVLCNPPFHKGFDVHGDMTMRFLQSAKARLKPGAVALFVVNQFIGLEQRAGSLFEECRVLAEREGFKVFLLKNSGN